MPETAKTTFRLSREDRRILERLAKELGGLSMSDVVRIAIRHLDSPRRPGNPVVERAHNRGSLVAASITAHATKILAAMDAGEAPEDAGARKVAEDVLALADIDT